MRVAVSRVLLGLCAAAISLSALSQTTAPAAVQKGALPPWTAFAPATTQAPAQRVFDGVAAVVDAWDTEIRVAGVKSARMERRTVLVQQAAALSDVGNVRVDFAPDYQSLTVHSLRIFRGTEVIDQLAIAQFRVSQTESQLDRLMVSGRVVALAQVDGLRVGDRLEFSYTVEGHNPVFGADHSTVLPWSSWMLVQRRRVRVVHPADQPLRHDFVRPNAGTTSTPLFAAPPPAKVNTQAGETELVWQSPIVWPAYADRMVPAHHDPFTTLHLSTHADWPSVRRWALAQFELRPGDSTIRRVATEISASSRSEADQVAKAVRLAMDDVRYFSVSLREASHRPAAPSQTLERRYGDCKDKSQLLVAILRELGVTAHVVLVNSQEAAQVQRYLPGPFAFDHAIVRVTFKDGRQRFVDVTRSADGLPYERMSDPYVGSYGLVLAAEAQGGLEPLAAPVPVLVSDVREVIEAKGLEDSADYQVSSVYTGRTAELVRGASRAVNESNRKQSITDAFKRRHSKAQVTQGFPALIDDKAQNAYRVNERYTMDKVFTKENAQNVWVARFGAMRLHGHIASGAPDAKRELPLAILDPYTIHRHRVELRLPAHVEGREDPVSDRMDTPHFSLTTQRSFRGNVFVFSAELTVKATEVSASEMPAFAKNMGELETKIFDVVVLGPQNLLTAQQSTQSPRVRQETEMRKLIAQASEVIEAAKLADADLANAFVERANARVMLGETAAAEADVQQALRRAPSLAEAYSARASIAMRQKRFAAGEADESKALSLGGSSGNGYVRRGQFRFLQGKLEAALADYVQAEKSTETGLNVGFMRIWQGVTKLRLQQPLGAAPPPLPERAWPQPIVDHIWGTLTLAQLESAARRPSKQEELSNLCEAYFYAAMVLQARGDEAQARMFLQKTLDTGVIQYMEYELAQAMLM